MFCFGQISSLIGFAGSIGDQSVESAALLVEYGIRDEPFTDEIMQRCPPIDWRVTDADCTSSCRVCVLTPFRRRR
jgi:exoribonuclease R